MYRSLIIILFFFTRFIFGQDYPCQVMVNMSPPYPITLSGYGSSIQEKINLTVLLGDISESRREVGLKFYVEGSSGFRAGSGDVVTGTSPLVLEGGVLLYLTQSDLSPYFRYENLQGLNPQAYGALLPEGMYQFCFEVYDWQSKRVISARSCAGAQLQGNSPPVLNLPSKGEYVIQQEPQNLIFQWSPMHINVSNVEYEFTLVELWDTGMDPGAAFLSGRPLYQVTTFSPTLLYGPSEPALLQGRDYAWRVRAIVWDGAEEVSYFYNNGYSEIFHFSYASPCSPPSGLRDVSNNSSMSHKLNWSKTHQRYHVQYRKKNPAAEVWFGVGPLSTHLREDNIDEELILYNLEGGKTYEYRVGGSCVGTGNSGGYVYSDIHEFTTRSRDSTGTYNCGEISGVQLKGQEPLERLGSNEVFTAGDYPVTAKEVYGSQGSYTGWGYMPIPYLRDTRIKVYFERISINSNYQLTEGVLKTEYDEDWEGVMQGLNIEFPEEEQAEAEAPAVVNSTETATESETGTTTEAGEVDEFMAYEEDPYELFEPLPEEEETTAETQTGPSGANETANSAAPGPGTGNINTPLQVQDNQLPDDQILESTAPGEEKLIDESGIVYNEGDIIYVDCNSEVYKAMRLIKGDYGSSLSDVVWKLFYIYDGGNEMFSKRGVEVYELDYGWLNFIGNEPGGIYKLTADFGSGQISVFIECISPSVEPMVIRYQEVDYQEEETISLDCKQWEHIFELLNHDPFNEEFIKWELASVSGETIYKAENGTGSKFTLDQTRLLQVREEFPEGIYQLIVHHNYTSIMVYIECRVDEEWNPLLIAQNTHAEPNGNGNEAVIDVGAPLISNGSDTGLKLIREHTSNKSHADGETLYVDHIDEGLEFQWEDESMDSIEWKLFSSSELLYNIELPQAEKFDIESFRLMIESMDVREDEIPVELKAFFNGKLQSTLYIKVKNVLPAGPKILYNGKLYTNLIKVAVNKGLSEFKLSDYTGQNNILWNLSINNEVIKNVVLGPGETLSLNMYNHLKEITLGQQFTLRATYAEGQTKVILIPQVPEELSVAIKEYDTNKVYNDGETVFIDSMDEGATFELIGLGDEDITWKLHYGNNQTATYTLVADVQFIIATFRIMMDKMEVQDEKAIFKLEAWNDNILQGMVYIEVANELPMGPKVLYNEAFYSTYIPVSPTNPEAKFRLASYLSKNVEWSLSINDELAKNSKLDFDTSFSLNMNDYKEDVDHGSEFILNIKTDKMEFEVILLPIKDAD